MDNLRRDIENFLRDITCEYYLYGSGKKDKLHIQGIYEKYSGLFEEKQVNSIPPEERKLRGFLISSYLNKKTGAILENIALKKAKKKFYLNDRELTLSELQILIKNTPDRNIRKKLNEFKINFVKELNPLYGEYLKGIYTTTPLFSYGRYFEFLNRTQNIDFEYYFTLFSSFLKETQHIYTHYMNKILMSKMGISLNSAEIYDIDFLFRGNEFDFKFPSAYLYDFLKEFLYNLGIDLEKQNNVHLDLEKRPTKNPRAFCAPCRVPEEVYLCMLPFGGYRDFETTLHEMGHTQHFAHTSCTLHVEDRLLGDMGLSEVFAFLFQYLLTDHVFVEYYFDIYGDSLLDFIIRIMLARLYLVRRYIAKFKYELFLHKTENIAKAQEVYRENLNRALFVNVPGELYLFDLDMGFYSANYLRAWFAESALSEFLRTKFGKKWFINKKAGGLLKELWFEGKRWQIEEMLDEVTGKPFDMSPLLENFKKTLRIF